MEHNQDRRRGHFHRGRRGQDRRSPDRRTPSQVQERQQPRDQVDVEQIMREIRGRVAQRQGVELTGEQIQDLAARRLESILDPRSIKPSLLEGLRRNAGAVAPTVTPRASTEPVYSFEDTTIYDSHRFVLRFVRKLLNPLLKLFFNPNPLIRALHLQARLNVEAAAREAEHDRRQAEWNALHYEIVQRLVAEISRLSIEVQALSTKVESLGGRVDFNDRRVRSIEGAAQQTRPASRPDAPAVPRPAETPSAPEGAADAASAEGVRRRRRRRRGRRGGPGPAESGHVPPLALPSAAQEEPGAAAAREGTGGMPFEQEEREAATAPVAAPALPEPPEPPAPEPVSDAVVADKDDPWER